jgi:hypothetical protein
MQKSLLYFLKIHTDDDLKNQAHLSELVTELKKVKKEISQLNKSDEEKISRGINLMNVH